MAEFDQLLAQGHQYSAMGRYSEAANLFAAAAKMAPDSHEAMRGLGIALSHVKLNAATAYLVLEQAAHLNGGMLDGEASQAYALSLAYGGNSERAAAVLDSLVSSGGTATQHHWRTEQYWQVGDLAVTHRAADDLLRHPDLWAPAAGTRAVLTPKLVINTVIGEQANRLELICKARTLGWPVPDTLILDASGEVVNASFLDYWRPHFTVVEEGAQFRPAAKQFSTFALRGADGSAYVRNVACALANREWARRGLPPVLSLTPQHRERGEAVLREMGIPRDAWYVSLHVRSSSFADDGHDNHNALRNAPVDSYLPAIRRIVEAGGWVVRMGDARMSPLPVMDGVVDYATSRWKSDWMDVFLCGSPAFFVATQSGLQCVAQAFGVPLVVTNVLPNSIYSVDENDLYIPRKLFLRGEGRMLSFREAFRPPYVNKEAAAAFERLDVEVPLHTAEEIVGVVDEMIERQLGHIRYTEADHRLQRRFTAGVDYHGFGQMGRLGRKFLRDHMHYL
jgi:putative glycosyltransferase (TIGR04372 family)